MRRAPRVRPSAALHQRTVPARAPCATIRASPRSPSSPLTSQRAPLSRPGEIVRRHFATDSKGKGKPEREDEEDDEDGIVQQHQITPWTKFVSIPPQPKRVVRKLCRQLVLTRMLGLNSPH